MPFTSFGSEFDYSSTLILGAVLLVVTYFLRSRRPRNFPPGPLGLPMLGYAPFFGENAAEDLRQMKGKYGPVMSIQMGTEHVVILNDFNSIQEVICKFRDWK